MNLTNINIRRKIITIILSCVFVTMGHAAVAQFMETFGDIGTMRVLKGQIRDGLDAPVPGATVTVKNVATEQSFSLDADERGVFRKTDLPSGKYSVTVYARGFNGGQYTVTIGRKDSSASNKYTVIRLSPGCASGNSGVALVSKLTQRSFRE